MDRHIEFAAYTLLSLWKKKKIFDLTVEPLFGDASGREYFRIFFEGKSCIMMRVAQTKPGEFGRGDPFFDFISMQNMLKALDMKVPDIYFRYDDDRSLLLEDLGDATLYSVLQGQPANGSSLIKKALDLLIDWQNKMWARKNFDSTGDKKIFKYQLFMDEFYHFYEYMVYKRVYYPSHKNLWNRAEKRFRKISRELSNIPYILSHRDFQSKNIMLKDSSFYLIDFQDALQAPVVYDLVALLRDSYIVLGEEELAMFLEYFWKNNEVMRECFSTKEDYLRAFYLQTVQRKMKDAGRFIYLHQVKGKEWFVPFVRPSLFYVKDSLLKLEMTDIIKMFEPFIPEFHTGE